MIAKTRGTKLRNLAQKEAGQFSKRLVGVPKVFGIVNVPNELDMITIMKFLIDNFGDLSADEIISAFEYNAAGRLREFSKDNEIIDHYQNFNIVFIGKVLSAYRDFREVELTKKRDDSRIALPEKEENKKTQSEKNEAYYERLLLFIEREKMLPAAWPWDWVYDHLRVNGIISPTTEQQAKAVRYIMQSIHKEANALLAQGLRRDAKIHRALVDDASYIQLRCKEGYAKKYFKLKLDEQCSGTR